MTTKTKFSTALKTVTSTIKSDKELYFGYQSNIAMAFYDEARKNGTVIPHEELLRIANGAAKNFLNLWIQ